MIYEITYSSINNDHIINLASQSVQWLDKGSYAIILNYKQKYYIKTMITIKSVYVILFGKEVEDGLNLLGHLVGPEDDVAVS